MTIINTLLLIIVSILYTYLSFLGIHIYLESIKDIDINLLKGIGLLLLFINSIIILSLLSITMLYIKHKIIRNK